MGAAPASIRPENYYAGWRNDRKVGSKVLELLDALAAGRRASRSKFGGGGRRYRPHAGDGGYFCSVRRRDSSIFGNGRGNSPWRGWNGRYGDDHGFVQLGEPENLKDPNKTSVRTLPCRRYISRMGPARVWRGWGGWRCEGRHADRSRATPVLMRHLR